MSTPTRSTSRKIYKSRFFPWVGGLGVAGFVAWTMLGNDAVSSADVDGGVLWSDETSTLRLGPGGWFAAPKGDSTKSTVQHATSGQEWTMSSGHPDALTSDGRAISLLGGVQIDGPQGRHEASADDIVVGHGDKSFVPTDGLTEIAGLSKRTVAVTQCLGPTPGSPSEPTSETSIIVVGVRLDDAKVAWTHDTKAPCDTDVTGTFSGTLPEQQYLVTHPTDATTHVLALDTGEVVQRLTDAPTGRVVVQGDRALVRTGDDARVISLRSGNEIATTSCPGARTGNPGDSTAQLSEHGTLAIECGPSVRLFDGRGFVTVETPPVGEDQLVPDGGAVMYDRWELRRDGETVHVRDAVKGRDVGSVEIPDDYRLPTSSPRGHLIAFFTQGEKGIFEKQTVAHYRVLDTRTGTLLTTTGDVRGGSDEVAPDGYVALTASYTTTSTESSGVRRSHDHEAAWVLGAP